VNAPLLTTTLLLLPGGAELALPENSVKFKAALSHAIRNKKAKILMLSDTALVPEDVVQQTYPYKNVLLIESETIVTADDAWAAAAQMLDNHLPTVSTAGFDFQVVKMEYIAAKYEDFERLAKFM